MNLLTRYTEFETRDLDETVAMNRANMRYCSLELRGREPYYAPYYVRVRWAQADLLTVSSVVNAAPVICRTELDPRAYLLWLRFEGHGENRSGSRLAVDGPGEILFTSPGRPATYTTSGNDKMLVVRIPADMLEREARLCAAQPLVVLPFEIEQPFSGASRVGQMLRILIRHLNLPDPAPSSGRKVARELVNALVTSTANNWEPLLADAPSGPDLRTVQRAEEYMEAHLEAAIPDVAEAVGVGIRWLEYSFARRRGCKPVDMRRTLRLDEALRRFKKPTEETTVSAVAQALGFTNLSRFALQFEEQFHEPPEITLRNAG